MRASRRVAVVRPQRRERPALSVSWLEIRRNRPMRGAAVGAGRKRLLQEDQARRLRVYRTRRCDLDLYGTAGPQAGAAEFRMGYRTADTSLCVEALARMQLAASAGGLHLLRARVL